MKRRLLATILCLCVLIGLFPATALASDGNETHRDSSTGTLYVYSGEKFTVALPKEMDPSVTISGYNDAEDWYVTDGLALHYDGIYNAGMGEDHDNRTETWVQLVEEAEGDLTISGQTWDSAGLTVESTGVNETELSSPIETGEDGMTVEQVFSIANVEAAMGTSGDYFYPIRVHISENTQSFGNVRQDGPSLNYYQYEYRRENDVTVGNGANTVLSVGTLTDSTLVTMTMTSDGEQTRAVYRDGGTRKTHTFKATGDYTAPENDYYSFDGVSIPASTNLKDLNGDKSITLEKTIYGLRVYDRELAAYEVAQNAALDRARFEDGTYVTPGTVNGEPLLEYDYQAGQQSTTVSVSGNSVELTLNELTDGRTLTFTDGTNTFTQNVVVMSEEDAEEADEVIDQIEALPDAESVAEDDETAISAAVAAYEQLGDQQKGRVGDDLKDKLDTCVEKLDEVLAGRKTYELTYDLNDDGGVQAALPDGTLETVTVTYKDGTFNLAVPTRANYTFLGWWYGNTQITDGSGASLGEWTILSGGDITAHWERTEDLGTESNPYPISSAEQWYALARILQTRPTSDSDVSAALQQDYAGFGYTEDYAQAYVVLQTTYYELQQDITLSPVEGYFGVPNFKGTLDGGNHTVTLNYENLSVSVSAAAQFGGLIQSSEYCVVKNLILEGTVSGTYTASAGLQDIGVLIGTTKTTKDSNPVMRIENVTSNVSVDLTIDVNGTATSYLGAMIGRSYAPADGYETVLKNCVNNGDITVTYLNANANTGRVGGLVGHAYAGTVMDGCKNYGNITHKGESTFNIGGMTGSGTVDYQNCVQGGDIESPRSAVVPFQGMSAPQSAGNVLEITITGTAGTSVTYVGGETKQIGEDGKAVYQIPVFQESGIVKNNAFSYDNYFTVNGTRLDFFALTSRIFSATIRAEDAANLGLPFQSESDALVITTAEQMLTLQKAINNGDQQAIDAIFDARNVDAESVGYEEARLALQSGYYKLGNDIELNDSNYTGVGTKAFPFGGHFDGGGHTITVTLSGTPAAQYVGVFGYVNPVGGSQPEIKSLNILSSIDLDYSTRNNTTYYIGSLAGALGSNMVTDGLSDITVQINKIEVITSHNDSNSDTYYVGGVVGYGEVSDADVTVNGPITAAGKGVFYAAGVTGAGSVQNCNVTFQSDTAKISAQSTDKTGSCAAILSAYTLGSMTFSNVIIENKTSAEVPIRVESSNTGYAGGIVGYMPTSTTNQEYWLKVDDTVQVIGDFKVSAVAGYAGGLAGKLGLGYSANINGFINTIDVSGPYAGGLFGEVNPVGELQTLTIKDSLNMGTITGTGTYPRAGALVGNLNIIKQPVFSGNAYLESSCDKAIGQVSNTGISVTDSEAAAKLDPSVLTGTHTYTDTVALVDGVVPTALTLAPAEYFRLQDDGTLQFAKAGTTSADLLWNGKVFFTSDSITVQPLLITFGEGSDVTGGTSENPGGIITKAYDGMAPDYFDYAAFYPATVSGGSVSVVEGSSQVILHPGVDVWFDWTMEGVANESHSVLPMDVTGQEGVHVTVRLTNENYRFVTNTVPEPSLEVYVTVVIHAEATLAESKVSLNGVEIDAITSATTNLPYDDQGQAPVSDLTSLEAEGITEFTVHFHPYGQGNFEPTHLVDQSPSELTSEAVLGIAPTELGTYLMMITGTSEDHYASVSCVYSIVKGTPTGSPSYTAISQSGKTLADAALHIGTIRPSGTISWDLADDTVVTRGTAYRWTFVPDDTEHYNYLTGSIVLWTDSSDGGGSSSSGSSSDGEYMVGTDKVSGGKVTVNPGWADPGDTVTITVKPDNGYKLSEISVTDSKGNELKLYTKDGSKYTFTMPNSRVNIHVSFVVSAQADANPFTDVSISDYYYEAVLWAVENGVTNGTSATTFGPNVTVTRAQMVTFLWRAHGSPEATGANPFTDVGTSDYYYDAVLWAVENGITVGTSDTTFSPEAPVTRAQAVTFQWRAAGSPVVSGSSFDDVAADAYYVNAVTWAVANGITNGTGGNNFSPDAAVSRAQAVTFLYRELA